MADIIGQIGVEIEADDSGFIAALRRSIRETKKFESEIQDSVDSISSGFKKLVVGGTAIIGSLVAIRAAAAGLRGVLDFAGDAVSSFSEFEQASVSLEVLLGSAEAAEAQLRELVEFGATTPFELPGLIQANQRLIAFGFAAEEVIPTLESLGNIAGGNAQKLDTLVSVLGKTQSSSKVTAEELNRLVDAGISLEEVAGAAGLSVQQLFEQSSKGQLDAALFGEALLSLGEEGGRFFGQLEKQSATLGGLLSNLSDSIGNAFRDIGAVLVEELDLKGLVGDLSTIVDGQLPEIIETVRIVARAIKPTIDAVVSVIPEAIQIITGLVRGVALAWDAVDSILLKVFSVIAGIVKLLARAIQLTIELATLSFADTEGFDEFADLLDVIAIRLDQGSRNARGFSSEVDNTTRSVRGASQEIEDFGEVVERNFDKLREVLSLTNQDVQDIAAGTREFEFATSLKGLTEQDAAELVAKEAEIVEGIRQSLIDTVNERDIEAFIAFRVGTERGTEEEAELVQFVENIRGIQAEIDNLGQTDRDKKFIELLGIDEATIAEGLAKLDEFNGKIQNTRANRNNANRFFADFGTSVDRVQDVIAALDELDEAQRLAEINSALEQTTDKLETLSAINANPSINPEIFKQFGTEVDLTNESVLELSETLNEIAAQESINSTLEKLERNASVADDALTGFDQRIFDLIDAGANADQLAQAQKFINAEEVANSELALQALRLELEQTSQGLSEVEREAAAFAATGATDAQVSEFLALSEALEETAERASVLDQLDLELQSVTSQLESATDAAARFAASGATEEEIARFQDLQDEIQKANDQLEGQRITEQFKPVADGIREEAQKLQTLLDQGNISQQTFDAALNDLRGDTVQEAGRTATSTLDAISNSLIGLGTQSREDAAREAAIESALSLKTTEELLGEQVEIQRRQLELQSANTLKNDNVAVVAASSNRTIRLR